MTTPPADPERHSHYFDSSPASKSEPGSIRVVLPDLSFELRTDAGVFSRRRLDPGTKILLQEAPLLPARGCFLDLGCGVGPIAVSMALRRPDSRIWAVDVNQRARQLTADNVTRLGLSNVTTAPPEDVPHDVRFDVIWSNPPIKIGKSALHSLLLTWLERLLPNGWALLVVHKNLGSDSLAAWLESQGWHADRLCSRQGYRLLQIRHR